MADLRESFPSLEDTGTGAGAALAKVQEGDAVAAKNASIAFSHKDGSGNAVAAPVKQAGDAPADAVPSLAFLDSSGNLVNPQLDAAGKLPVVGPLTDTELRASPVPVTFGTVTGDGKRARGTAAGNASLTTVATLTLATSKIYENLDFIVSCFRDARFQVILSDNAVETIIADAVCGPGCTSFHGKMQEAEIATGATGTQLLLIKALNLNSLSDFYASMSVKLAN